MPFLKLEMADAVVAPSPNQIIGILVRGLTPL